jgi:subtilisin family serine protease
MKFSSLSILVSSFLLLSSHFKFAEGGKNKEANEKGKRNRIHNKFLIGNEGSEVNDVSDCDEDAEHNYIVVFKKDTSFEDVKAEAELLTKKANGKLMKTYSRAVKGFSATLTCKAMNELNNNPDVAYIEEDGQATVHDCATATQSSVPSWGLDRIDSAATQSTFKLDGNYSYVEDDPAAPQEVHVYVIDTGINSAHDEFVGRLGDGYNAVANNETHPGSWEDCRGHGTHVAGTIGGKQYGVAKNANITLHAVRIFGCPDDGDAVYSDIIEAFEWVILQCENTTRICVANGSFGARLSLLSFNEGAASMVAAGIVFVVSAGNDSGDACQKSPASAEGVIAVGSTTIDDDDEDHRSDFSNYGKCVDIFAPVRTQVVGIFRTETVSILFLRALHYISSCFLLHTGERYQECMDRWKFLYTYDLWDLEGFCPCSRSRCPHSQTRS